MEYRIGEVWLSDEIGSYVECVKDQKSSCEHCVFNEDGGSCPAKSYNWHPCYHSDREDGEDVHFVHYLKTGDKVIWDENDTPVGQERLWNVHYVDGVLVTIRRTDDDNVTEEVTVPVIETVKVI